MKIKRLLLTAAVLATLACHGSDSKAVRKDQQYDVVQEGETSGASSTINAPGEAPPVAGAPLTGTGADTTTNFNSTPAVMSTAGAPAGTLAGTLPPPMPGGSSAVPVPRDPNAPAPRQMTSSSTVIPTPPLPRRMPAQTTQPKQRPEMPPPATTTDDQTTTSSDTTDSTSTSTQPPPDKKKSDEKSEKTDTTSTEPPPPPPPPPVL